MAGKTKMEERNHDLFFSKCCLFLRDNVNNCNRILCPLIKDKFDQHLEAQTQGMCKCQGIKEDAIFNDTFQFLIKFEGLFSQAI